MTAAQLESGYWRAYRDFYRWSALWRGAATKPVLRDRLRHLAYAGGWKKFEPVWDVLIRSRHVLRALPLLESALGSFGARRSPQARSGGPTTGTRRTEGVPGSARTVTGSTEAFPA